MNTDTETKVPQVDIPSLDGENEAQEFSFEEILGALEDATSKEIILDIPAEQLTVLIEGLQNKKAKKTHAAKKKGLDFGKFTLKFNSYPAKDKEGKEMVGIISVHIQLKARAGIEVFSIREPDPTL